MATPSRLWAARAPSCLVLFFLCLGQNAEIGGVDDFRFRQCGLDFLRSPIAVDLNDGFSKGLQRRLKFRRLLDGNGLPEMGPHILWQFCLVDEKFGFAPLSRMA